MKLQECCEIIVSQVTDELVLASLAGTSQALVNVKHREGNLYAITMGVACGMGLGLSLALPHRKVVVLEGDGSLLLNMGILTAIAEKKPTNLVMVITDNECYEAVGVCSTTPTASVTDLEAVAKGCGIRNTATVKDTARAKSIFKRALNEPGPWFIVAKVETGFVTGKVSKTSVPDMLENKYQFVRHVERTENLDILVDLQKG